MTNESKRRIRDFELGRKSKTRKSTLTSSLLVGDVSLAGSAAEPLSSWLADTFNHNFDLYDKAVDAAYNATHIGGSKLHHIVDGQHSILGAFRAVQDVSPDDSWTTELYQAGEHLLRDTMSKSGANPLFSMDIDTYHAVADVVAKVGISRTYFADALTVNGPELFGGSIALVGSLIMAKKADPSNLSLLGGSYVMSAAVSANPLLITVAAGSLAYAAMKSGDYKGVAVQAGKGAFASGSALLVSSLVGGPLLGCVAGAMTAIAVKQGMDNPQKAWERTQALMQPAKSTFDQVSRQLRKMKHEPTRA